MENNLTPEGEPKEMSRDSGAIYRIAADGRVSQLTPREFGITNTMVWTRDGRFLTADTLKNALYAYDLRGDALTNKRMFAQPYDRGFPDGSCLDSQDGLWNCRVAGGASIVRFSPEGSLDRLVELPCSWPTSCTFGDRDFSTLFVTSARFTMSPEQIRANPEEGAIFSLEIGMRGRPENRFG